MGFVVIGKGRRGRWNGQTIILGSIRANALAKDMDQANQYLERARKFLATLPDPEIDPNSLEIAKVTTLNDMNMREL